MPDGVLSIPERSMLMPQIMPPTMPTTGQYSFFNLGNPLYQYHDPGATTNDLFQNAIKSATPSAGISSGYQSILDTIKKQQDYATGVGTSAAQSLAAKRGLTGSSIEQFGTQQAVEAASRAAQDASTNALLQNESQQNALRQLQAQLYGSRAQSLAGLNSDELTSLRNADFSQQQLAQQGLLGQQQIDLARANIGAAEDIASEQARNSLISSGASILAPYLLPKLFGFGGGGAGAGGVPGAAGGGGSGVLGGLFNIGGGNGFLGLSGAGGAPLPAGALGPASPGMFGPGGALFNTAGTSTLGASNILPGLAGWQLGTHTFGDNRYTNTGGIIGGIGGSIFGPAGSALGAFLGAGAGKLSDRVATGVSKRLGNTAGSIVRYTNPLTAIPDVAHKVSNVFPF